MQMQRCVIRGQSIGPAAIRPADSLRCCAVRLGCRSADWLLRCSDPLLLLTLIMADQKDAKMEAVKGLDDGDSDATLKLKSSDNEIYRQTSSGAAQRASQPTQQRRACSSDSKTHRCCSAHAPTCQQRSPRRSA